MIPVFWLSFKEGIDSRGPWDTGILEHLFRGTFWPSMFRFEHHVVASLPEGGPCVVVLPARHHAAPGDADRLNEELAKRTSAVLMLIGDEEAVFPWREVRHPNLRFWVMLPNPGKHADLQGWAFFLGDGWKDDTPDLLHSVDAPLKDILWSFAGQVTHERRKQAANGLLKLKRRVPGELLKTAGFTQGLDRAAYLARMARTRIVPCPSGNFTPDTFRFFEALEAGCLPLADATSPAGVRGYWQFLYGADLPFPEIEDWESVGGMVEQELGRWPKNVNRASAWWRARKREMQQRLDDDLVTIGAVVDRDVCPVTVVITTSPIPSHPSPQIIVDTIASVRSQIPDAPIIIACDGVRPEQEDIAREYAEYIRQLCWRQHQRIDVQVVIADRHIHQAGVAKLALAWVDTPLVLMVEHDTPFDGATIDWERIIAMMEYGGLDVLRFHHEAQIHPEHEHLMIDHSTVEMLGVPIRRTTQWSQRPHLASAAYYRVMLAENFPDTANCFIEDKMHGIAQQHQRRHRLAIYHPEGSIRRTLHSDGRANGPKFDDKQRFQ